MDLAVARRVHILENADIDGSGTGVGNRVQVHQQWMPVQVYLEMAVILSVLLLVHIRLPLGIGEIEPQFVHAGAHRDVVTNLTLRLRDRHIGGNGFPHGFEQALISHGWEEMPPDQAGPRLLRNTGQLAQGRPHTST